MHEACETIRRTPWPVLYWSYHGLRIGRCLADHTSRHVDSLGIRVFHALETHRWDAVRLSGLTKLWVLLTDNGLEGVPGALRKPVAPPFYPMCAPQGKVICSSV